MDFGFGDGFIIIFFVLSFYLLNVYGLILKDNILYWSIFGFIYVVDKKMGGNVCCLVRNIVSF